MTPKDKNILDILNLLVLLHRSKKQMLPKQPEEELDMLLVTEEHLQMSGLTMPVFLNALDLLGSKGYALYMSPFAKQAREEIARYQKSDDFSKAMAILAKQDSKEMNLKLREAIATDLPKIAPKDMTLDMKALMNDDQITIENLLREANAHVLTYTPDTIATVMLLPFRRIERLLEKMNSGMKFDEVQDAGIWYDSIKFEFRFGEKIVSTAYNNTPMLVHFILDTLFNELQDLSMDYSECSEFSRQNNKAKEKKKFSDAMRGFVSKNPELSKIFRFHSNGIEIQKEYRESAH